MCSNNHLRDLPEELAALTALKELYINKNRLVTLPPLLFGLGMKKGLNVFNASNNELKEVPPGLCECLQLKHVTLYQNDIVQLPFELLHLRELESLHVYGNPLMDLPKHIYDHPVAPQDILTALKDVQLQQQQQGL